MAQTRLSLNDPVTRGLFYQALVIGGVVAVGWYLIHNTLTNLESRSIATGYSFLLVGLLNTLKVSAIGIAFATLLGVAVGIARLSSNFLVARLASAFVEVVRNIPPLLQLFFWYALITESMPAVRQALEPLPGVFITQRGLWV